MGPVGSGAGLVAAVGAVHPVGAVLATAATALPRSPGLPGAAVTTGCATAATVLSLVALVPQLVRVRRCTEGVSLPSYLLWALSMLWWGLFSCSVGAWVGAGSCALQIVLLLAIIRHLHPTRSVAAIGAGSAVVGLGLVACGYGTWALVGAAVTTVAAGWPQLRLALGHPDHLAGVAIATWAQYAAGLACWAVYEFRIHQPVAMAINLAAIVPAVCIVVRVHQAHRVVATPIP